LIVNVFNPVANSSITYGSYKYADGAEYIGYFLVFIRTRGKIIIIVFIFTVDSPHKQLYLNSNNKSIELKKIKVISQHGMKKIKQKNSLNFKTILHKMILKKTHNYYKIL